MIYFIQAQVPYMTKPVKIGYTVADTGIWQRLDSLQTGCPWELIPLKAIRGSVSRERELHKRFDHLRMRREWFDGTPELIAFIMTLPAAEEVAFSASEDKNELASVVPLWSSDEIRISRNE